MRLLMDQSPISYGKKKPGYEMSVTALIIFAVRRFPVGCV